MEETRKVQEMIVASGSLERITHQPQHWRAGRKPGERIPAPLWAAAVGAAREHGLHRVATGLHLNYAVLNRRAMDVLIYFNKPIHEFSAGLEALHSDLLDDGSRADRQGRLHGRGVLHVHRNDAG